jgi:hypothetical protein
MEAEDPMNTDDIEAQDEAGAREHASEERRRGRSQAPKLKRKKRGDCDREYGKLFSRRADRIQRDREDQIGLRMIDVMKSTGCP